MDSRKRTYLAIDLKSFYASVEWHRKDHLPCGVALPESL